MWGALIIIVVSTSLLFFLEDYVLEYEDVWDDVRVEDVFEDRQILLGVELDFEQAEETFKQFIEITLLLYSSRLILTLKICVCDRLVYKEQ